MEIFKKHKEIIYFIIFLFIGLVMFFHQFVSSGFDVMPGSLLDARLINYILEHIYSWVIGVENHRELFSMPFYYPMKNTLFLSDTFLSVAPIYIFYRLFFDPYHSYGFLVMTFVILNYVSFYFLLKKIFKIDIFYIALGAFLFTFSLINYFALLHPQMLTQFFTVFAFLCLLYVDEKNSARKNYLLFIASAFLFGCQFYSSFYLGFFYYFGAILFSIVCIPVFIFSQNFREKVINFLKKYYKQILVAFCVFLILVIPLGYFYLQIKISRSIAEMYQPINVFNSGSILWSHLITNLSELYGPWEKNNFGYFTLFFMGLGLFKFDKKFFVLLILGYMVLWNNCPINIPRFSYEYIPGASAIRFWQRMIFFLLPFMSLGIIYLLSRLKNKVLIFLIILLVFLEQIPALNYYGWKRSVEIQKMKILDKKISKDCKVISVTGASDPAFHSIDSMWFAHYRKIYSRVGFSGFLESQFEIPFVEIPPECTYYEKYSVTHPINLYN